MSKNILLIGGAGYIGTPLTESLLKKNYKIRCFDSLIYSQKYCIESLIKKENYEFILGDLRNYDKIDNLLSGVTDVVILAGLVGDPITKKYPNESKQINYVALKNFIDKCNNKKIKKVIFVSTCSNYGLISNEDLAGLREDEARIRNIADGVMGQRVESFEEAAAIASGVFVTTITDVIGFLSFLGIGSFFFLN